jgi:hypothetical protein
MSTEDNRGAARIYAHVGQCRLKSGDAHVPGYVLDLAAIGARVLAEGATLRPASTVEVEMRLAGTARDADGISIPARVRWVKGPEGPNEEYLFGLEFTDLDSAQADVLNAAIADFNHRRAEIDTLFLDS